MALVALAYCPDGECRLTTVDVPSGRNSVEISAAVGADAPNRHGDVRVIQDALNQVPPTSGGPVSPLKVDGLCYGKTLAAIRRFQKDACGFKWPDGRISPGGKTHTRLREFFIPANPYTMPRVYLMLPQAVHWILAAKRELALAELHLQGKLGFTKPFQLVDKYFHVGTLSPVQALASIARIRSLFVSMEACIGHSSPLTAPGTGYFQEDPVENRRTAYTLPGGFTRRAPNKTTPPMSGDYGFELPSQRMDSIFVCPRILNIHSDGFYIKVILHELAHFCGGKERTADHVTDHSYRRKPNFFTLTPHLAVRTADCYSEFAGEAKLGVEPPSR
jgi:hypothetical protein